MPNKPLREIVSIKKGKQLNIENMVHGGTFLVLNGGITPSGYTNDWNTEANTITISEGGNSCGYVSLVKQRFWSGGHNYTLNDCKIDKHYLYQYLKHKERQIMALRVGSGLPNIQMRSLVDFEVPILNEKEHYRIGSFLSAIDRLIENQKERVKRIKSLKKEYLQKIFPTDEVDKPQIRFGAYKDRWNKFELVSVLDVNSGRDYKHLESGNIPVYGTGGYMLSVSEALSRKDAIGIGRKGTIDKPFILKAPFWTVDTLFYVVPKTNNNLHFLYAIFQNTNWKKFNESTGVPSLSKRAIELKRVYLPLPDEQEKIGSFISTIDRVIEKEEALIGQYQSLKKGYLQKIFAD